MAPSVGAAHHSDIATAMKFTVDRDNPWSLPVRNPISLRLSERVQYSSGAQP